MEFQSVINTRYPAPILSKIWSPDNRIKTMRQLWIYLAAEQQTLGIKTITNDAIQELVNNRDIIDYDKIQHYETRFKHDIIAHIHAYGDLCPNAKKILHLGATSNYINDNTDSILIKDSIAIISNKTQNLIQTLTNKSFEYAQIPTIAYTHLQPAQLITIGRRFSMWTEDISMDLHHLQNIDIPFRGIKGTVGTEDTLLKLFNGDTNKCDILNDTLASIYGFNKRIKVCGQTYSRKYDVEIIHILSSLCQSIYKIMNDLRLLSGKMEVYEYFSKEQVGSSAMPYKKNPITCEKLCSLCRYVINQEQNITQTYINQWLERTLDDSSIKRIIYPECFLLLEYILDTSISVIHNLFFNIEHINSQVKNHMVNVISEEIILKGVEMGYSRLEIHEKLRKILTNNNVSYEALLEDNIIADIIHKYNISFNPLNYIGRSIEQCYNTSNL
jgi:adenylosuccinate lyase